MASTEAVPRFAHQTLENRQCSRIVTNDAKIHPTEFLKEYDKPLGHRTLYQA
jgi:hypothetical protein